MKERRYRCPLCQDVLIRRSSKKWIRSYCCTAGKFTRITLIPEGNKYLNIQKRGNLWELRLKRFLTGRTVWLCVYTTYLDALNQARWYMKNCQPAKGKILGICKGRCPQAKDWVS